MKIKRVKKITKWSIIVFIGFLLSPLTPWDDLFTNIPISWIVATMFAIISKQLFTGVFIITYWLTNIIGLVMLHEGARHIYSKQEISKKYSRKDIIQDLIISLVYSVIILILIYFGILQPIQNYFK